MATADSKQLIARLNEQKTITSADSRSIATALRDQGVPQTDLYKLFETRMLRARDEGEEDTESALLDTMDLIYSGPWAKGQALYDTQLNEAQPRS